MNLILIWSLPFSIQGKEHYLCDFVTKKFNIDLYSDIYRPISLELDMVIETTKLYIFDISWDDLDLHARSQLYEK